MSNFVVNSDGEIDDIRYYALTDLKGVIRVRESSHSRNRTMPLKVYGLVLRDMNGHHDLYNIVSNKWISASRLTEGVNEDDAKSAETAETIINGGGSRQLLDPDWISTCIYAITKAPLRDHVATDMAIFLHITSCLKPKDAGMYSIA